MPGQGAELDGTDTHGRTPLMLAAKCGCTGAVQWLLELGADWRRTDKDGMDALALAKHSYALLGFRGRDECAALLETWAATLPEPEVVGSSGAL